MVYCLVYPTPDCGRAYMRRQLGLTGLALWLMASGLTACAAQTSISAGQLLVPTSTSTLPPAATATPTAPLIEYLPTRTPVRPVLPAKTATAQPAATEEPVQPEPAAVLTPEPNVPPAPDGVLRSADVPILMYHYISASPSAQDRIRYGLSVPPEMLEAQVKLLRDNGFTTVTLRDLYEYLVQQEEGHRTILQGEYDQLTHTGFWFDLREFDLESMG